MRIGVAVVVGFLSVAMRMHDVRIDTCASKSVEPACVSAPILLDLGCRASVYLVTLDGPRHISTAPLTSGRLPVDDLKKFANGEDGSSIEKLFENETAEEFFEGNSDDLESTDADREIPDDEIMGESGIQLPEVSAGAILDSVESEL